MASRTALLLCIFCLLAFFGSDVDALECYSCYNAGCNDPFESSGVKVITCPESCLKGKADKDDTVYRGCGVGTVNECKKDKIQGVEGEACTCTTDKCNGAGMIKMNILTTLAFTAFVVALKIFVF